MTRYEDDLQRKLDELQEWVESRYPAVVVVKLHTGAPGPDLADNLYHGDGEPQTMDRRCPIPVSWLIGGTGPGYTQFRVSVWSATEPVIPVDGEFGLREGDTLTLTDLPPTRIEYTRAHRLV